MDNLNFFLKKNIFSIIYTLIVGIFLTKNVDFFLTINKNLFLIFFVQIIIIVIYLIYFLKIKINHIEYLFLLYFLVIWLIKFKDLNNYSLLISNLVFPLSIFLLYKVFYNNNKIFILTNNFFIRYLFFFLFIFIIFIYFPILLLKLSGLNISSKYYLLYLEAKKIFPDFKYWANYIHCFISLSLIIILKNFFRENKIKKNYIFTLIVFYLFIFPSINFYNLLIQLFFLFYFFVFLIRFKLNENIIKKINLIFLIIILTFPSLFFFKNLPNYSKEILIGYSKIFTKNITYFENHMPSSNCSDQTRIKKMYEYFFIKDHSKELIKNRENLDLNKVHLDPYYEYCINGAFARNNISLLRRYDQINNIFNDNLLLNNILKGFDEEQIILNNNRGNFTHNSYLNLIMRYGLLSYLIFFLIMIRFISNNYLDQKIIFLFLIFMFFQNFDDYLFGNRLEVTVLFWFLFFSLTTKKKFNEN